MLKSPLIFLNLALVVLAVNGTAISIYMLVIAAQREARLIREGFVKNLIDRMSLRRTRRAEAVILLTHLLLVYINVYALWSALPQLPPEAVNFYNKTLIVRGLVSALLQYNSLADYRDRRRIIAIKRLTDHG